uniref:Uncharacterized protein n=1 Tax=Molossus molossus TaxID=27622 RepID=A0A7J8GQ63_MOLMO|nr:hypothetical protein HJG59_011312 [Molossus molossus]
MAAFSCTHSPAFQFHRSQQKGPSGNKSQWESRAHIIGCGPPAVESGPPPPLPWSRSRHAAATQELRSPPLPNLVFKLPASRNLGARPAASAASAGARSPLSGGQTPRPERGVWSTERRQGGEKVFLLIANVNYGLQTHRENK